jgi:hypothetical protein
LRELAGDEQPVGGAVECEFGRRPGEDEKDRIHIPPDQADEGLVGYEGEHGITSITPGDFNSSAMELQGMAQVSGSSSVPQTMLAVSNGGKTLTVRSLDS